MFESSFIDLLTSDSELVSMLSTYRSEPSIFSEIAPESAEPPYIVFEIETTANDLVVSDFRVIIDIYDNSYSGALSRNIEERIAAKCDHEVITDDTRFSAIRLFYEDGRAIENTDISIRHRVVILSAKGGRKKFAEEIAV